MISSFDVVVECIRHCFMRGACYTVTYSFFVSVAGTSRWIQRVKEGLIKVKGLKIKRVNHSPKAH